MSIYRYHWTPRSNLASIAQNGLDPQYARGAMSVVWSCDESRILWAVGHVAKHHETTPDQLVLLRIRIDGLAGRRTSWPCVTVFDGKIAPSRISVKANVLRGGFTGIRRAVQTAKGD